MKTKHGKCPQCCPDGGAIFHRDVDDDLLPVWKCNNCGHEKPATRLKPLAKPTAGQQAIIDRMLEVFGGAVEVTMQGRKVWAKFTREVPWHEASMAFGSIAANGRFKITVMQIGGEIEVTDWIGVGVYMASKAYREAEAERSRQSLAALEMAMR